MEIDDKSLFDLMQRMENKVGRIESAVDSMNLHISAISAKAGMVAAELRTHERSLDVHGLLAEKQATRRMIATAGIAITATSLFLQLLPRLIK